MAEIKLGTKHDCFNCGTKFYDLAKGAAICPKCGADQKDAEAHDKPAASQARKRRRAEPVPVEPDAPEAAEAGEPAEEDEELAAEDLEIVAAELDDDEEEAEEEEEEA